MDESKIIILNEKASYKRIHTVLLHLYEIL